MIYKTLDEIPLKLYIRIQQTGNYSLLNTGPETLEQDLREIWLELQKEYNKLGINPGAKKILDVSQRIELLKTKHNFVITATNTLNFERDEELEKALRNFRYKLRVTAEHYIPDLVKIKKEASGLLLKVKRLERQLPKQEENKTNVSTLDRVIMGYCSVTGLQYDTNKITVTQFSGLKSLFEDKMQALEKQKAEAKQAKAKARTNKRR